MPEPELPDDSKDTALVHRDVDTADDAPGPSGVLRATWRSSICRTGSRVPDVGQEPVCVDDQGLGGPADLARRLSRLDVGAHEPAQVVGVHRRHATRMANLDPAACAGTS